MGILETVAVVGLVASIGSTVYNLATPDQSSSGGGGGGAVLSTPNPPPMSFMMKEHTLRGLLFNSELGLKQIGLKAEMQHELLSRTREELKQSTELDITERVRQEIRQRSKIATAAAAANIEGNTVEIMDLNAQMQQDYDTNIMTEVYERGRKQLWAEHAAVSLETYNKQSAIHAQWMNAMNSASMDIFGDVVGFQPQNMHYVPPSQNTGMDFGEVLGLVGNALGSVAKIGSTASGLFGGEPGAETMSTESFKTGLDQAYSLRNTPMKSFMDADLLFGGTS